ncbi:MAG: rod shape-determining protein MreC [Armatimonadetes bacterium]|nr:rod shape-determining protein MreC [Armatimonadota bacterium]
MLGKFQNQLRAHGAVDPISKLYQTVYNPPIAAVHSAGNSTIQFLQGIASARGLAQQNASLKNQLKATLFYSERITVLEQQLEDARAMSGFASGDFGRKAIKAQVIAYLPHERRMTLNVGSNQGVEPMLPVVGPTGLAGIVSTVTANSCQMNLIISPQVQLGAMIVRDPNPAGLIKGTGTDSLVIEYLEAGVQAQVGDLVVTSGYSSRIPRGIRIGQVVNTNLEAEYGSKRVDVAPFMQVSRLEEVVILK